MFCREERNIVGVQFHQKKSGRRLKVFKNTVEAMI